MVHEEFDINNIDLRKKFFRARKSYWRAIKAGKFKHSRYKKPVLTAIKLDPRQAILAQCRVGGGVFILNVGLATCIGNPPETGFHVCRDSVRGVGTDSPRAALGPSIFDDRPS